MARRPSTREIEAILRGYGFRMVRQRGSHRHWRGVVEGRVRLVTLIAGKRDYHPKTLRSIILQSGLRPELFD